MPRFYFDLIEDGDVVVDPDGLLLARTDALDFDEAVGLAESLAPHVWHDHPKRSKLSIVVRDEHGRPAAVVKVKQGVTGAVTMPRGKARTDRKPG